MADKIWVNFNKISDTDGIVETQNYVPNDTIYGIPSDIRGQGVFVDSIPEPIIQTGQTFVLHINPTTLQLFYIYSGISIDKIKENKIDEVTKAYQTEAYGTFTSNAFDGKTVETYSCSATDQTWISGQVTAALVIKAGYSTNKLSWKNVNQPVCVEWQADNIIKLGSDLQQFQTEKNDYYETLLVYINGLQNADDINKVTYGMVIPS